MKNFRLAVAACAQISAQGERLVVPGLYYELHVPIQNSDFNRNKR
jgi:hypothetical protein